MTRLKRYFFKWNALKNSDKKLLLEILLFLGWSRLLIVLFHFRKVAAYLEKKEKKSVKRKNDFDLMNLSQLMIKVSRHTFWKSNCLTQALAAKFMLNRRGIESVVCFGVLREEDAFKAHAWIKSGELIVTGEKGMERFNVIKTF
jgi:hypothetical protein